MKPYIFYICTFKTAHVHVYTYIFYRSKKNNKIKKAWISSHQLGYYQCFRVACGKKKKNVFNLNKETFNGKLILTRHTYNLFYGFTILLYLHVNILMNNNMAR